MDYYETRPREVIFYWRGLAPKRQVSLKLDLTAAVPGQLHRPRLPGVSLLHARKQAVVRPAGG